MLQKMLANEEKVHEVLEQAALPRSIGSSLHIPSFLPKEVKELLAELVMVEEEISRLEGEVSKTKQDLRDSQEGQGRATLESTQEDNTNKEKLVLETSPLFFINQAIKGDYTLHSFTRKEKNGGPIERQRTKERQMVAVLQEKQGTIGMIDKQFSPKLPSFHSLPMKPKLNLEISSNLLREPSFTAKSLKKINQKWQPNKLSEKIMKCLMCIFLRLIRTSRVMDSEKLGNKRRATNLLSRPASLRADASLNLKASFNAQRETIRQDPYGIFEIEESLVRDIGPYKNLVRFTSSYLDSRGISNSLPLLSKLRVLLNGLHEVDLSLLTHQEKLAFWINMHNTCIMHGFLEHGFPLNPQKSIAPINKVVLNVGGEILNASEIEHFIIRQPSSSMEASWKGDKDGREDRVRRIYGLEHSNENVSFALCRGDKSSPSLKIYTAESVYTELERSKVEYLQASVAVTASKRLMIPKLLLLNMGDFAEDLSSLLDWIFQQLPASGSLRKCMTECLRGKTSEKISEIVDILPYNLEFQYLLPM